MSTPRVINLSGPDGSGKTTIARLLYAYLHARGERAVVHWFRGTHLFASIIARSLSRLRLLRGLDNPYYNISIPPSLRQLWVLIEFVSIIPYVFTRRVLSRFMIVIGDRGLLDFLVWLIATLNYPRVLDTIIGRFLTRCIGREFTVYVMASPSVIKMRARGISASFLMRELAIYQALSRYYARCVIDTSDKTPLESLGELFKCIL